MMGLSGVGVMSLSLCAGVIAMMMGKSPSK